MMPCKTGEGWVVNKDWSKKQFKDRAAVERYAMRRIPPDLKRLGFGVGVWEGPEYFRYSYDGRK